MLTPSQPVGRFEQHTLPDGSVVFYEPDMHGYFGEIKSSKTAKGGYSFVQSSRLTGVSTIAKFLDANVDPLMYWAAKLDQIGIAELAAAALDAGADITWLREQRSINEALRDAEATWAHVRDRAAIRGTNVHERIFLALATGTEPPSLSGLAEEERGYGQAVFAWWRDRKPEPVAAEQVTVAHSRGFAGRFDLLADVDSERILIDAKTREKGAVRMSDHVQLAGYEASNIECGIGESERRIALILMPDGTYREVDGVATEADFNSALLACKSGKQLTKRMRDAEREAEKDREAVRVSAAPAPPASGPLSVEEDEALAARGRS